MENIATNSLEITQKITYIVLNIIFFVFINFSKNFRQYIRRKIGATKLFEITQKII